MDAKFVLKVAAALLLVACLVEARNIQQQQRTHNIEDETEVETNLAGRRPHPASPGKQARLIPAAVAIKKLVLLKFKKVIPISLILLRSTDENEAELVPVYPTSEIPEDVQFISTPNGISGHKDVQAIAIPTELHQHLEINGLANIENLEALINQAGEDIGDDGSHPVHKDEDELLNVKEEDEDQLLEGASADKPKKPLNVNSLRRLAIDDLHKSHVKAVPQATVEEIPLFLYSAKDSPQVILRKPGTRHSLTVRRHHS